MDEREAKEKFEAEIGPFLHRVYGSLQYPNTKSHFCSLNIDFQKQCIFKEGILHKDFFRWFPKIDNPNYLSSEANCSRTKLPTTTPPYKASTAQIPQSNPTAPAYSPLIITPVQYKPAAVINAYTQQRSRPQHPRWVENNDEHIYSFLVQVTGGEYRKYPKGPIKKMCGKLHEILTEESRHHVDHYSLHIIPKQIHGWKMELQHPDSLIEHNYGRYVYSIKCHQHKDKLSSIVNLVLSLDLILLKSGVSGLRSGNRGLTESATNLWFFQEGKE